jgi:hypothetical protein
MQPVYINHIASIHADTASGNPLFVRQEPDYKSIITNAALRRRMSRIIKMGVACGLECISTHLPKKYMRSSLQPDSDAWQIQRSS